jgi:DNA topoisomerase-3
MRLFLAEKPSLARAIADVLPGPQQRRDGYIQCGGGDVVAWCAGHILELATPDSYDPGLKQWRLEPLPIVPDRWKLTVSAPDLLKTIRGLLPRASRVVHAGDPDREGQLLIDEVLEFLGYRGPVDRLLISDLNPPAVRKSLAEIQTNARFRGLYEAALARQRADWLYGINLTRLYTLLGRAGGYDGVLSVGRVQTPLLGLIVRRDSEIDRFEPRAFYVLRAAVRCAAGVFSSRWEPPEQAGGLVDEAGRLVSREHALALQLKLAGQPGTVTRSTRETKGEPPPLPYSLPELQIDAGKRLRLSPKQTLDACQALYETHRLLTYPRSDSSYLPEGQHAQAIAALAAIATNVPSLAGLVAKADRSRKSRAWNDKKVTAHHAVVPTPVAKPEASLSAAERGVYDLVARRYLAQFHSLYAFHETRIELSVEGERLRASGRETITDGWMAVLPKAPEDEAEDEGPIVDDEIRAQVLPVVREGETITCADVVVAERHTAPPKPFTDATLIQAMTGIARFVDDPNIKQLLRETDGIGTPATQAQIIQTLFDRKFIEKRGRQIQSTAVGRTLIQTLPALATKPDMTALWEAAMRRIGEGQMPLSSFLDAVIQQLRELVASGRALVALRVPTHRGAKSRDPTSVAGVSRRSRRVHG